MLVYDEHLRKLNKDNKKIPSSQETMKNSKEKAGK